VVVSSALMLNNCIVASANIDAIKKAFLAEELR